MNIIFGASGHAKEVDLFLRKIHSDCGDLHTRIFVVNSILDSNSNKNSGIITEEEFVSILDKKAGDIYYSYLAIGNGRIRKIIVNKFEEYSLNYPNLISKNLLDDSSNVKLGVGNIFFPSSLLTIDIIIGNHNHFNLNTSISHDCRIGDYNTFSPGVKISGSVQIGNNNFFGVGACVIDKAVIADNIVIGAGAVVTQNLTLPGTYVGVPARRIK